MRNLRRQIVAILAVLVTAAASLPLLSPAPAARAVPLERDAIAMEAMSARLAGARLGEPADQPAPPARQKPVAPGPSDVSRGGVGRKPSPPSSVSGRKVTVTATAYTTNENSTRTYSGTHVTPWYTLAVDPKEIPLGSWVFIPYFKDKPNKGWFYAEDIGGAIKSNRIDVYMEDLDDALQFGVRQLEIVVSDSR
ncbi:MAG: 3D domain-containing protein [Bacillota bacterium]